MQSVIKNANLYWGDFRDAEVDMSRWMTPSEFLLSQGFPVAPIGQMGDGRCSFNMQRPLARDRLAMVGQAGNSMNLPCVGVCILQMVTQTPGGGSSGNGLARLSRTVNLFKLLRQCKAEIEEGPNPRKS